MSTNLVQEVEDVLREDQEVVAVVNMIDILLLDECIYTIVYSC